jgi:transposase-like protein
MSILADFGCNEQEYIDQDKYKDCASPEECPWCGGQNCLIGHGTYQRKAIDEQRVYVIRVKRWYCKNCHRTLSILPNFLLPYRQYLVRMIQGVVVAFYEFGQNWGRITQIYAQLEVPNLRTMQRWCKAFARHAPT